MNVILASASPRRKEILSKMIADFSVIPAENECALDPGLPPEEAVKRVAASKAQAVFAEHPEDLVIGSDTAVLVDSTFLGKPQNEEEAKAMLRLLSGRSHRVLTAVAILSQTKTSVFCDSALVEFAPLAEEEIRAYVASGEPMDKAGAYGIQGLGGKFVTRIDGDFFTVMGLPCAKLYQALKSFDILDVRR